MTHEYNILGPAVVAPVSFINEGELSPLIFSGRQLVRIITQPMQHTHSEDKRIIVNKQAEGNLASGCPHNCRKRENALPYYIYFMQLRR